MEFEDIEQKGSRTQSVGKGAKAGKGMSFKTSGRNEMMIVKWHDRKDVKAHFADWKKSDDPFLLLHVPDTQEIRDARLWMKAEVAPLRFAAMQHSSEARIVKDIFLKELAEELDGDENFPAFYEEFNQGLPGYFPAAMRQGVGNHAQAGDEFSAEEISQNRNYSA